MASNIASTTQEDISTLKEEDMSQLVALLDKYELELDVVGKIKIAAAIYHVNESIALNIACVESNVNPLARNPYSTASGVYQFVSGTWTSNGRKYWGSLKGRNRLNPNDNIDLAMNIMANVGFGDWSSSKSSGHYGGWSAKPFEHEQCI